MNISPIKLLSFSSSFNSQNKQIRNSYNLPCDTVSFTGKKHISEEEFSPCAKEGVAIGKKILKLSRSNSLTPETLNGILNENSPVPVQAKDLHELPSEVRNNFGNVIAHMLPGYTPDFQLAVANIYLGAFPKTAKEESNFAANVAHEYTHVQQRAKDENYYGILNYTNDIDEVTTIARLSQAMMNQMCKICQQELYAKEKDLKKVANLISNNKFDIEKSIGKIDFNRMIEGASDMLAIQMGKKPEDMKNAIKGWILQETENEKEAYTVSANILERSKCEPNVKASEALSREMYSYINKMLEA